MPSLTLAFILSSTDALIGVLGIALWLVVMCLKTLAADMGRALRVHNLRVEAHRLRLQQKQRLAQLATKCRG